MLSCLAGGWGEEAGSSAESLAAAMGPEAEVLPLVLGHGLDRLPDGGHQHNGKAPKGKKGGMFHLEPFVANLIDHSNIRFISLLTLVDSCEFSGSLHGG